MTHKEFIKSRIYNLLTKLEIYHDGTDLDNIYRNYFYIIGAIAIAHNTNSITSEEYQKLSFIAREEKEKAVKKI